MNFMTVMLLEQQTPNGGAMMWIFLIAMFVIMYFFMIRPQNKKQKEIANKEINDSDVILEISQSPNVRIRIDKNSIFAAAADAAATGNSAK